MTRLSGVPQDEATGKIRYVLAGQELPYSNCKFNTSMNDSEDDQDN